MTFNWKLSQYAAFFTGGVLIWSPIIYVIYAQLWFNKPNDQLPSPMENEAKIKIKINTYA